MRCPDALEMSSDVQLLVISLSCFYRFAKCRAGMDCQFWNQSKAPASTPLAMLHPPLKSLPLESALNPFLEKKTKTVVSIYISCLLFSLTVSREAKYENMIYIQKIAVLVSCSAFTLPAAGSSAAGVASPMESLGTALSRI